jgi:diguanylate cyclase (GGDEF)-like protein
MGKELEVAEGVLLTTETLGALDLFRGEDPEYLDLVLYSCQVRSLVSGEVLLEPDNDNDALYIILTGRAEVQFACDDLCSSVYLESGECAGEMSVIEGSRPSARVVAHSHCHVLVINAEVVWVLIERSSVVARNLLHILSKRMRRNNLELVQSNIQRRIHERDALHDPLTGLQNRRWLERTLARIVKRCARDGEPLALLMIDTDHFKRYNDEHGHLAGDQLLAAIARVINENVRSSDHSCRYGGDEFVVVLPRIGPPKAMKIAERMCRSIREQTPNAGDAHLVERVSVSIGVASLGSGMHVRQLLASADAALYRAKAAGRDGASN